MGALHPADSVVASRPAWHERKVLWLTRPPGVLPGKFMISATAVLNSMKESMVPTSTETTDIAGSLVSGADCLLLAGPTSDVRSLCMAAR